MEINRNKIESLTFTELVELKNVVNEVVLRNNIQIPPSAKFIQFNNLLASINSEIEKRVINEYYQ